MNRMTFTLDNETVERLSAASRRLGKPKSAIVRDAIAEHIDRLGRLTSAERRRMLDRFDEVVGAIPRRPAASVDRELNEIRRARKRGGRRPSGS